MLHYATALIQKKEICKNSFANFPQLLPIIDKYMICTNESGNLDEKGHLIKPAKLADGCSRNTYHLRQEIECDDDYNIFSKETRRSDKNVTTHVLETQPSRKQGICQNDHGGPLVRWIGSKEMLIGVASVFGVTKDNKCTGPYLFTSTQCNSLFLDCVINENKTRRTICDKPPIERGFDKIEKHISWMNHPDG
ncbi:unnamed protein product [Diatraea saccharalis]|uniref:Peptidase S1 domain-containing protein n=1 Tax=Diatraea saccharalis TaxID=40085 RepID=A0A9N9RCB3_9NEOP|nr:unnamed protein product [Diatraea saccharalis]